LLTYPAEGGFPLLA